MNNKELIAGMSARLGKSPKDVQQMVSAFVTEMASHLSEDDSLAIQGFGTFEVKKKLERVVTNPNTKQKMLVPPRLALSFKPSLMLKDITQTVFIHGKKCALARNNSLHG